MTPIAIRDLRPEDYDALISLWEEAGLPYKPKGRDRREQVMRELRQPTAIFVVAEMEGRIIGSVLGTHDGRKGWINRVAVSPAHRRRGVARELVLEVEKRLSHKGLDIIACLVEDWNEDSMGFFEKLGYVKSEEVTYFSKRRSPDT